MTASLRRVVRWPLHVIGWDSGRSVANAHASLAEMHLNRANAVSGNSTGLAQSR